MSRRHGQAAIRISMVAVLVLLVLLALLIAGLAWRESAIPLRPQLPVAFEHADHASEQCADCHHNFIDDTGGGACYNCHKMSADINAQMEAMFHDFCRDCHIQKRHQGEDSGPVRECSLCHTEEKSAVF